MRLSLVREERLSAKNRDVLQASPLALPFCQNSPHFPSMERNVQRSRVEQKQTVIFATLPAIASAKAGHPNLTKSTPEFSGRRRIV